MANKVRIGLLGAGRIGKLHGENLAHAVPNADLYAVADPFMNDATRAWAADMGIEKCYDDPEMIFGDPTIEAVFICSLHRNACRLHHARCADRQAHLL